MADIKQLLNKKGWTGREIGKLLIASFINDVKNKGKADAQPLFSQKDFERMERSLSTDNDYTVYGVYRDIYSSVIDGYNWGQSLSQQFYNGYYRLLSQIRELQNADHALQSLDNTPLIMTESQYKRLEEQAAIALRGYKHSFSGIVFYCLSECLEADEDAPETIPPAIKDALEAAKKIPATGNRFLPLYNETFGEGYYQLPDGRRSDQMSSEEWQKALEQEYLKRNDAEGQEFANVMKAKNMARFVKCYELFFKGADAIREFIGEDATADISDEDLIEAVTGIIDRIGAAHTEPLQKELEELLGYVTPTEWHYYENPPEGLTLYDILEMYCDEYDGEFNTGGADAIKHLKADAPAVYAALSAYIEELLPQARGLKANQLNKDIASWGELADAGLIGYKKLVSVSKNDILESKGLKEYRSRYRTIYSGIAIIKDPASSQVNENGDYIEPESPLRYFGETLDTIEQNPSEIDRINGYIQQLIYPALSYLYAFNALMGIIGKVYDLPELPDALSFDTEELEEKIDAFNSLLYIFYHDVYGEPAEKQRKRDIIKATFYPLDVDSLKPTQEAIDKVTGTLAELGFSSDARKKLKYLDKLIARLRNNGEGAC